jgi:recombination protein RecT
VSTEVAPLTAFVSQYEQREAAYAGQLPAHIPAERFKRVLLRAVQKNPDLLTANRASLLNAAMDAATDGLLPDGREGAIVTFNTRVNRDGKWVVIKQAQWMPMIAGILKKVRNSGELKSITANLVYGGDIFRYWVDENGEHLNHEPADNPEKSIFRRAYAMAITNDGGVYISVMDAEQIAQVQAVSRSKDKDGNPKGPWADWWEEMVKKTVMRRLAKKLPTSADLDDLMRRDDALYDLEGRSDRQPVEPAKSLGGRLDQLADQRGVGVVDTVKHDADGVVIENGSEDEGCEDAHLPWRWCRSRRS